MNIIDAYIETLANVTWVLLVLGLLFIGILAISAFVKHTIGVTAFIGLLCTLVGLSAYILAIPVVLLARRDSAPSYVEGKGPDDPFDPSFVVRGDPPAWLAWFATPDMRLPGGMYEPFIRRLVGGGARWRWWLASYFWLGHRNRMHGLAHAFGHQTTDYIPDPFSPDRDRSGWVRSGNVWTFQRGADWQRWRKVGSRCLVTGYQVHRLLDGRFWAVPVCTVKKMPP